MAKKITKSAPKAVARVSAKPAFISSTPVRNTPVPRAAAPARREATAHQISQRAYEIWQSQGGTQEDNWFRAERELRGL